MRVGGKQRQYGEEGEASELMSESYSRRSWKGIAIAFLVIGAVAAIVALIVIYSGAQSPWSIEGTLKLDDVINGKYSPKTFSSAVWASGETFMYMKLGNLWSFNIPSNSSKLIVSNSTWGDSVDSFYPSPSGKLILYPSNKTKQFRYSYNASFSVVSYNGESPVIKHDIAGGKILQYAGWGPTKSDNIVFVRENNIYYLDKFDGNETQVTKDGHPGIVYNGVPDWVYEEEVLADESAIWWSPNGNYFAFLKFNDTEVPDMYYMHYGDKDDMYPTVVDIKYPKPGFNNPEVTLWVVSISQADKPQAVPIDSSAHYVTGVMWANDTTLAVMWGPRVQNETSISFCSGSDWKCSVNYYENTTGWFEPRSVLFKEDGKKFYIIRSREDFKHIYQKDIASPSGSIFITGGNKYEVTDLVHYEKDNIYYIRTDGAEKRRFYRLSNITTAPKEDCLSCNEDCDWASASVSTTGKYYALTCSSFTAVPTVQLFDLHSNVLVRMWEDNQDLKDKLANQTLCTYIDYTIPVKNSDPAGDKIKIRVFVPKNFSESRRYPALINVYGGPGSQMIQNTFSIDFGTYLVTNKNYLYVEVDGRGSAFRGDKILYSIYKRLGTVEIQDQITAMRYLLGNQSYVDPNRVAIWGWSYGGYAAAMTLAQGKDIFSCAMSVAPVTSWRYYDSVYTERYMLEPDDNADSYRTSSLMNHVSDFKNKPFLLLHGTADDNVHLQQSMMLTKALNNASVLFDMHVYPDENHSIPKSKLHVHMTLEEFLSNCFA